MAKVKKTRRNASKGRTPPKPRSPKPRNPMARDLGSGLYRQRVAAKKTRRNLPPPDSDPDTY